jgi:hypothetical protein
MRRWLRVSPARVPLRSLLLRGASSLHADLSSAGFATVSINDTRIAIWEQELARQQKQEVQRRAEAADRALPVTLTVRQAAGGESFAFEGVAGVSTPIDVLKQLHERGLPKIQALAAVLDGDVMDLRATIERSGELQLLECVSIAGRNGHGEVLMGWSTMRTVSRATRASTSSGTRPRTSSGRFEP